MSKKIQNHQWNLRKVVAIWRSQWNLGLSSKFCCNALPFLSSVPVCVIFHWIGHKERIGGNYFLICCWLRKHWKGKIIRTMTKHKMKKILLGKWFLNFGFKIFWHFDQMWNVAYWTLFWSFFYFSNILGIFETLLAAILALFRSNHGFWTSSCSLVYI